MSDEESEYEDTGSDREIEKGSDREIEKSDTDNEEPESPRQKSKARCKAKNKKEHNARYKYTSDGLARKEYKDSDCADEDLKQVECCHQYFKENAFSHRTVYGLEIQGIETCIHCYIKFNAQRYTELTDLTKEEEECLKYYIENFTEGHDSTKCTMSVYGSKCFLCEARNGRMPKIFKANDKNNTQVVDTVLDGPSEKPVLTISDIFMVDRIESDFMLTL